MELGNAVARPGDTTKVAIYLIVESVIPAIKQGEAVSGQNGTQSAVKKQRKN